MRRAFLVVGLVLSIALLVWVFVIEPSTLVEHDYRLTVPALPATCSGLTVAVVADLHAGSPYYGLEKVDAVVAAIVARRPALILLAGDYVIQGVLGGTPIGPSSIAAHLKPLASVAPVYAVLGNHDWWMSGPEVTKALSDVGFTMLDNRSAAFEAGACRLTLIGIGDFLEGKPDVAAAMSSVADEADVLALTHNPDVFPQVPSRVALTVAGHTHGGQVLLPLLGRPVIPSQYGQRYAAGEIVEDGKHLFVSTGLGTSIAPVRFRVPPEVSFLTLTP